MSERGPGAPSDGRSGRPAGDGPEAKDEAAGAAVEPAGPRLVVVCGLPGVGKSTVARRVGENLDAAVLRSDAVRKELFPDPEYSSAESDRVYDELFERAAERLDRGSSVVLDATFRDDERRRRARAVAERVEVPLRLVKVECRHEVVRERIERRDGISDADFDVYRQLREEFVPIEGEHVTVDNSGSEAATLARVDDLF